MPPVEIDRAARCRTAGLGAADPRRQVPQGRVIGSGGAAQGLVLRRGPAVRRARRARSVASMISRSWRSSAARPSHRQQAHQLIVKHCGGRVGILRGSPPPPPSPVLSGRIGRA